MANREKNNYHGFEKFTEKRNEKQNKNRNDNGNKYRGHRQNSAQERTG
jgi:hypothetical protein